MGMMWMNFTKIITTKIPMHVSVLLEPTWGCVYFVVIILTPKEQNATRPTTHQILICHGLFYVVCLGKSDQTPGNTCRKYIPLYKNQSSNIPRGVYGLEQPEAQPSLGRACALKLDPINKWSGLGLHSRKPKA